MARRMMDDATVDLATAPFMKIFGGSMTNIFAGGEACTKACLEWQEEWLRFVGARLKSDAEAQKSLSECDNLSDAAKIQQDWFAAASRAYLEEAGKLMQITTRAAHDSLSRWKESGRTDVQG